jgi:hypothetical protein
VLSVGFGAPKGGLEGAPLANVVIRTRLVVEFAAMKKYSQ